MSDIQNLRRQRAQEELGLTNAKEQKQMERAMRKEEERKEKKMARQMEIETSGSYRAVKTIATCMDKYFLDPIIGFFMPGVGDILTSVLTLPYIYVSLFKIRSIPLTLAVVFNMLVDCALGLVPWVGDLIDVFHRANLKNYRLIVGYVEDDKEIISKVNKRAGLMAVLIAVMCLLFYMLADVVFSMVSWVWDFIAGLFA